MGCSGEWDDGAEKRGKERAEEVCVQKEGYREGVAFDH